MDTTNEPKPPMTTGEWASTKVTEALALAPRSPQEAAFLLALMRTPSADRVCVLATMRAIAGHSLLRSSDGR